MHKKNPHKIMEKKQNGKKCHTRKTLQKTSSCSHSCIAHEEANRYKMNSITRLTCIYESQGKM